MDFVPIRARDDAVLRITARQVHTITEPPLRAQITDQLVRYFPARCRYLGAMRLDDAVRAYMQGARHHGMHTEREIAACVHLMFLLGHDMHRDPQLPWVARLLGEDRSPWRRIVAVRAQAMAYLDRIHGRDNAALDRSLARLSRLTAAELEHQVGADNELGTMFALLRRLHPEKVEALGEPLLESLWAENHAQSRSLGLDVRESQMWLVLQFTLGSGIAVDPQYPWIAVALARRRHGNLLHDFAGDYFEHMRGPGAQE